ncbi:MAG: hypothetical protein HY381_01300 [Candidatus Chisholmbacteria bacterium]|nr:hypothetical protein [Candidatus Chisholmbacteria bacterium]
MNQLIFLILASSIYYLSSSPAHAQATDSATPVPPQLVEENIKKRLDRVVEEKATESGQILAEKTLLKKAYVGTLKDIANQTLTLETKLTTRQVSVSGTTTFVQDPGRKPLKASDLELGKTIIAMGFVNGTGVMEARRIVVLSEPPSVPSRQVYLATITEINTAKNRLTFTTTPDQQTTTVNLTSQTTITSGSSQAKAAAADLGPDTKILIVTTQDKTGNLTTLLLHLL